MPATLTRAGVKIGEKRPDALLPVRGRNGARPPGAGAPPRPVSPTMAPEEAVASLVETGSGPGAAEARRAILTNIQRAHGNRYASQVVAEFHAQDREKPERVPTPAPPPAAPPTAAPRATAKITPAAPKSAALRAAGRATAAPGAPSVARTPAAAETAPKAMAAAPIA